MPPELSSDDYELILSLLPQLYLLQDLTDLPQIMMQIAAALIPNLFCTYNELHPATQNVVVAYRPEEWRQRMEPYIEPSAPYLSEHPVYTHVHQTGDGRACAISDFITEEAWQRNGFYKAIFEPLHVRDTLIFCLVAENSAMIFLALNRATWGFSERDKQVANLLRSHFTAAYNNAVAFTESHALSLLTDAPKVGTVGVAAVNERGQVIHANEESVRLIRKYFQLNAWNSALPNTVQNWLSHESATGLPASTLEEISGLQRLVIRWGRQPNGSKILLLREQHQAPGDTVASANLSRRESEVLGWLVEGKTNAEIASILSISVRTVEKHVEMIYRKLGVETRTGAMLRIFSQPES